MADFDIPNYTMKNPRISPGIKLIKKIEHGHKKTSLRRLKKLSVLIVI